MLIPRAIGQSVALVAASTSFAVDQVNPAQVGAPARAPTEIREVIEVECPLVRRADQRIVPAHLHESVIALDLDQDRWSALSSKRDAMIAGFQLGPNHTASLVLHRTDPFEHQPTIVGATIDARGVVVETPLSVPSLDCYVGSLLDDPNSRVLLSRCEGFVLGYVQSSEKTWIITNGRAGPSGSYGAIVSYAMDDVPPGTFDIPNWTCEVLMSPSGGGSDGSDGGLSDSLEPCWQSRIGIDTDVEFLALFGNNTNAAIGYVGTLFAALSDIYPRDVKLKPGMSFLRLWTGGNDPWGATSTSNQLYEFQAYWEQEVNPPVRDSTAMISGRGLGGGVAWLNSGCGGYAYSVSANIAGTFPYPLVDNSGANWDIMVFAHELGHNYGAPHTHNYTPPADGCGSSPQDCTAATNDLGTIMSYCHTCAGGMSNINLYFHELNVASMQAYLGSSGCPFSAPAQPPVAVPERLSAIPGTTVDIDVLGNDVRFNCELVSLWGVSQPAQGCTAIIVVGAGPDGRDIVRFTSPVSSATTVTFNYTIAEVDDETATAAVTVDLTPMRLPENPIGDTPGIETKYYALTAPAVLPDFTALTPYSTTSVPQVNFASTGGNFATSNRADQVGATFIGWLNVPTAGTWTLFTNSDDGSRLLIGTTVVVANDGLHGMVEKSGSIDLAPGRHAIRMEFFENGGGAGMIASWSGPGTAKAAIPAAALTMGGTLNRADINLDGNVDGADMTALLSAWGSAQASADINQDGIVDGTDLTTLLAAWSN